MTILEMAQSGPEMSLGAICRAAWASADQMCWALSTVGIEYSVSSCKRLRSGAGEPRYTLGCAIRDLAEAQIQNDIAERRARLASIRRRRRG